MEEQTPVSSACPASDSHHQQSNITAFSSLSSSSCAVPRPTTLASSHLSDATTASNTSTLTSSLRFPKPEGSHLLAHWVTSSSTNAADTMQSSAVLDETSSLADSAYELISSTDGESQDGRELDSLAASITSSFNLHPRADDVVSLNGHEAAYGNDEDDNEEEEDEDDGASASGRGQLDQSSGYLPTETRNTPGQSQIYHAHREGDHGVRQSSPTDSIQYAEQALCNPSTQSLSTLEYDSSHGDIGGGGHSPLVQSIEFREDSGVKPCLEKVQVKHTIREFSRAESAIIAASMGMVADAPSRMAATICQTMSRHCLSTHEPLRVLYVGSEAAYSDITYKISSAILASNTSPNSSSREPGFRRASTPGIYNIVPLSSFGSAKVPEIDEIQLMGVSDYYIKVERCIKAVETVYKGEAFPNETVFSIDLDSGQSHVSVFCPSGSTVTPPWTLPHVAIFYVSGNDDAEAETTRNSAWEFMTRHAVPSIFISHSQSFTRSPSAGRWQNFVDQSAVHLCLESRDPSKPMAPERLPIDLVSFLNIDARQMNRNLAYLTGLKGDAVVAKKAGLAARAGQPASLLTIFSAASESVRLFCQGRDGRRTAGQALGDLMELVTSHIWEVLLSLLVTLLLSTSLLVSVGSFLSEHGVNPIPRSASYTVPSMISPTVLAVNAARCSPATTATGGCSAPPVAPTVTISLVSTKTVEVRVSEPSSMPSQILFGGYLTDSADKSTSDTEIKTTGCSIQVYSDHEILVKVPAATKTKWLAKGAIDIDVWRGHDILRSKLSTTDEGIIIDIDHKDAFGIMSVSIVTTLRPKINETFAVDFGQPSAGRLFEAGLGLWKQSLRTAAAAAAEAAEVAARAAADRSHKLAAQAKQAVAGYADEHNLTLPSSARAQAALDCVSDLLHASSRRIETLKDDMAKHFEKIRGDTDIGSTAQKAYDFAKTVPLPHVDITEKLIARRAVLRAQIASKLWWLRVQGKAQEHDAYAAKAAVLLRRYATAIASHEPVEDIILDEPTSPNGANEKEAEAAATSDRPTGWFW